MKKLISLFAVAVLGAALIGCSKAEDTTTPAATAGATAGTAGATAGTADTAK